MLTRKLLLLALATLVLAAPEDLGLVPLERDTFRTSSKHIILCSTFSGISHLRPGLEVARVLKNRGHRITYVTAEDQLHLTKSYDIPAIAIKSGVTQEIQKNILSVSQSTVVRPAFMMTMLLSGYHEGYTRFRDILNDSATRPDFVMCDSFNLECIDAAHMAGIPYTTFMSGFVLSDVPYIPNLMFTSKPSTEFMSIWERINVMYLKPGMMMLMGASFRQNLREARKKTGVDQNIPFILGGSKASFQLLDGFFGYDIPRPLNPRQIVIGPVLGEFNPPLTPELSEFLSMHQRVAYVAFGQHAVPSTDNFIRLIAALSSNLQDGTIDGVIWANRANASTFPSVIDLDESSSFLNTTQLFANENPSFFVTRWAPQFAILNHPSTALFISHGGALSTHEATFTATRMLLYPFFGDQPSNAGRLEKAGVALQVDRHVASSQEIADKVRRIVHDEDGSFKESTRRMQVLAQLGSKRVELGADVVEEALFASASHLGTPAERMSWAKAHDYDIYAIFFVSAAAVIAGFWKAGSFVMRRRSNRVPKVKKM